MNSNNNDEQYPFIFKFHKINANNAFLYLKIFILSFPSFNIFNQVKNDSNLKTKLKTIFKLFYNQIRIRKRKTTFNTDDEKNTQKEISNTYFIENKIKNQNETYFYNFEETDDERVFTNTDDLIDFIIENNEFQQIFLNEIRSIIDLMNEILYRPPYTILFGRINIEKSTTNNENHIKDINEIFYQGFTLKLYDI